MRQRLWTAFALSISIIFPARGARADRSPFDAWAQWVTSQQGKWNGQQVPFPEAVDRPAPQPWVIRSWLFPLSVHAPGTFSYAEVAHALVALEQAYELLALTGWPTPLPDGGAGGTGDFDLYLQPDSAAAATAFVDDPVTWSFLDSATSYAAINPRATSADGFQACAISALVQAVLINQDPAEAYAWRQATGAFVAWLATGQFGCDDGVVEQQRAPWGGWITDVPERGGGGALFLAMLSEVQDGGTGTFVRELWQFARQQSRLGEKLRGSPDLYEAMARALTNSGQSLDAIAVDFAVARYFSGPTARRRFARYSALRVLPSDAEVPVVSAGSLADLPKHLLVDDPPIETFGSHYTEVRIDRAALLQHLRIWLRGEYGARWSLVAIRLDAEGGELGRVDAPPKTDPNSYLPVELTADTARVLIVVTNLIEGVPDADDNTRNVHAFELILDKSPKR